MRVAILCRDYPPRRGGLSTYAFGLVQQLRALGVSVDVLIGYTDLRTLILPLSFDLSGYDVVHVMSPPYAAFVRHPHQLTTVAEPAATEWPYYSLETKLRAGPAYLLEKFVFGRGKCFVALSEATRQKLMDKFKVDSRMIRVIPGGVDFASFTMSMKLIKPPRILLVSRLDRRKNIQEAMYGFAKLREEDFEVVIVGDGPERSTLESLADSLQIPVRFAGNASDEQLHAYFAESPIFVTSSLSEGFGLSLLQAMAAGCAVLASDIPAHRELVHGGVNGLLFQGVADLSAKLVQLLHDPSEVKELGTRGRNSTVRYAWKNVAIEMRTLYEELCRS